MKSSDLETKEALSVERARVELQRAEEADREHKQKAERQREEERRQRDELIKAADGVAAGVREQVEAALAFAEENPPQPTHHARSVARGYRRGVLVAPGELMPTAETQVAAIDPALAQLFAAAQEAANRLNYFCNPTNDALPVWLGPDDEPIREMDRLETLAWRQFTRRIRVIAAED
jgi:hypothetical protein